MAEDSAWTTIRVRKDVKDRADETRRDDESWNDFIARLTDEGPKTKEVVEVDAVLEALGY